MAGLDQERGRAGAVIQIAIIGVDRPLLTGDTTKGIGETVVDGVRVVQPVKCADRDRRVETAFDIAEGEHERLGGGCQSEGDSHAG